MKELNYDLYIPSNVKTRTEIFEGYGKNEIIQSVIASAVILGIGLVIFSFNESVSFIVVFVLSGISASIMCVTKDKNNQSVVDHLKNLIAFTRNQQSFKYKYLNEWGDF